MDSRHRIMFLLTGFLSLAASTIALIALFTGRSSSHSGASILHVDTNRLNDSLHDLVFQRLGSSTEQNVQILFGGLPSHHLHFLSVCEESGTSECLIQSPNYEFSVGQLVIDKNNEQYESGKYGTHYADGFGIYIDYPAGTGNATEMMTLDVLQSEADALSQEVRSALQSWATSGPVISFFPATVILASSIFPILTASIVLLVTALALRKAPFAVYAGMVVFVTLSAILFTSTAAIVTASTRRLTGVTQPLAPIVPNFSMTISTSRNFTAMLWIPMVLAWIAVACLLFTLIQLYNSSKRPTISAPSPLRRRTYVKNPLVTPSDAICRTIDFIVVTSEPDAPPSEEDFQAWLSNPRQLKDVEQGVPTKRHQVEEREMKRYLEDPELAIRVSRFSDVSSLSSHGSDIDEDGEYDADEEESEEANARSGGCRRSGGGRSKELGRPVSAVSKF